MKKTVKLNETELIGVIRNIIKESRGLLNEGPGAGYKMTFKGLSAVDVRLNGNQFTAKLQRKPVEWSAEAAYWSVSSEGVYYDGQLWEEFDDETNMVIGGEVSGYIDSDEFAGTEEDLQELNDELSDFGFEDIVGGGYIHTYLDNPMGFGGGTNEILANLGSYGDIVIEYVAIDAPGIVQAVNWMADNWHRLEDEYCNGTDEEELDESWMEKERENRGDALDSKINYYLDLYQERGKLSPEQYEDFYDACDKISCFGEEGEKFAETARNIVMGSKDVIRESFENSELSQMVAEHGGLKKQRWAYDSRSLSDHMDLQLAKPVGYIPHEVMEYIDMLDKFTPISDQVLVCNDGGMIVVESGKQPMHSEYETQYQDKIHNRTNNYLDDQGKEKYPYIGVNKWDNEKRRAAHLERRGKATKGLKESMTPEEYAMDDLPDYSEFWDQLMGQVGDLAIYLGEDVPEEVTDEFLQDEFKAELAKENITFGGPCDDGDFDIMQQIYNELKEKYGITDAPDLDASDYSWAWEEECQPDGFRNDAEYYRWRFGDSLR